MTTGRRFLLTNDDGIDAPGLAALARAVEGMGGVEVVAPTGPRSGCGHQVTTHAAIGVVERGRGRFAVDGTPADCVRLAFHHLTGPVDWVISGINAGGNLGVDVHHSGTVAAAREAAILGRRAIAISHYIARGREIDWDEAARLARTVIAALLDGPTPPDTFWNVNLPHLGPGPAEPAMVRCPVDPSPLPIGYRLGPDGARYAADYQGRARRPGGDVATCFGGAISVSLVPIVGEAG